MSALGDDQPLALAATPHSDDEPEPSPEVLDRARSLSKQEIMSALKAVLEGARLEDVSIKCSRRRAAAQLGLPKRALDDRKGEVRDLTQEVLQQACLVPVEAQEEEDIGEENDKASKSAYLITFSHPKLATTRDGIELKAPSTYSRRQILEAIIDCIEKTQGARLQRLNLKLMCCFREKHAGGDLHDHVAILADRGFRSVV